MEKQALVNQNMPARTANPNPQRFGKHRYGLQRFRCLFCRKTFTEDHEPTFRVEGYLRDQRGVMMAKDSRLAKMGKDSATGRVDPCIQ